MEPAPAGPRWWPVAIVLALFVILVTRIGLTYREFNATWDEEGHIAAGVELYQFGAYTLDVEHPPLARLALGLLPYLSGIRLQDTNDLWTQRRRVLEQTGNYWRTLTLARIGTLAFVPLLIWYTYKWGSELYGIKAGLAACALVTFSPNIIAHASLATVDFAVTATTFAAAYHIWKWSQRPDLVRCVWAALAIGMAVLSKFSALAYVPSILVLYFLIGCWQSKTAPRCGSWKFWKRLAGQAVMLGGVVLALTWAVYGFSTAPWTTQGQRPHKAVDRWMTPGSRLSGILYGTAERAFLPPAQFLRGVAYLRGHLRSGHDSFLLGARSSTGWWYYFPVVLAVKSTIPMLLLVILACIVSAWNRKGRESAYLEVGAGVILGAAMWSSINIGVRHILPIYPFLAVLGSAVFAGAAYFGREHRRITALSVALLAWHMGESLYAHPDYLAYFNSIARGRESYYLADSNLDWGQDLARLGRYLQAHGINEIHLSYFGVTTPAVVGIKNAQKLEPGERPSGWVAISISHLQGMGGAGVNASDYDWLENLRPRARIGKSILLYYAGPADDPRPPGY